jgi:hypothetical protein
MANRAMLTTGVFTVAMLRQQMSRYPSYPFILISTQQGNGQWSVTFQSVPGRDIKRGSEDAA